jgi:rubrerythrin
MEDYYISYKSVVDILTKNRVHFDDMVKITSELKELPSITPSTGTWIETDDDDEIFGQVYKCSICGLLEVCGNGDDYCPKCGSKMNV